MKKTPRTHLDRGPAAEILEAPFCDMTWLRFVEPPPAAIEALFASVAVPAEYLTPQMRSRR